MDNISLSKCLKNIVDNRGKTCPTSKQGIPLIATNCIKEESIYPTFERVRYVSEETYKNWFRGHPNPGDILFVNKGTPGRVCLVPDPINFCIAQDMVALQVDESVIYPPYLFAILRSNQVRKSIENMHVGTMIPHFKKGDFDLLQIPLPKKSIQIFIGDFYNTVSQKILCNIKTAETLEEIAKALFKSWFIDFDPVKAKVEGRSLESQDKVSNLFPDSFEDSELGEIPNGWKVKKLGEIIELAYGKPLKESDRKKGSFPVFGSNGIVGFHEDYLVKGPGIIIGRKGNPGIVKWSDNDFFPIDTTFYVKQKNEPKEMIFLFFVLWNQKLSNLSADSAVPGLNRNIAYMNKQVMPSSNVMSLFEEQVRDLFLRKKISNLESSSLQNLRDSLLPKLISGEIRIPDAEKMIEEAEI